MIDPNKKEPLPINPSEVCYRAFELIAAKQFADAEKLLAGNMARTDDNVAIALYHSVLGVLFKLQGEYKTAWRHYERAEKLMPDDPALKIISARLLIDQFAEYGLAIKKSKKVLDIAKDNPIFTHQAYTTMGLAHCKKGDKKKALEMIESSIIDDFNSFVSAKNIDYELVEAVLRKGWGVDVCRAYLMKALAFANKTKEDQHVNMLQKMLTAFETEYQAKEISLS
jgi:tetratricopeptide (TPR) repeat protein